MNNFNRYLFVVNPISGDRDKSALLDSISHFCTNNSLEFNVLETTGNNDPEQLTIRIREFKPEVIVAAGGDGTVNLVAKQILNTQIVLGVLPMGSGNGLSKDLNIPQGNVDTSMALLCKPKVTAIDTLEVNGHFFIHLCDVGFNAHIVKLFSRSNKRGLLSYMRFAISEFFKYKTTYYTIKTDGGDFRGRAFMITIANTNRFGSNLIINPNGKFDDGFFEVIIIKRFPRNKILGIMFRMLTNKINFSPYSHIIKCTTADIIPRKKRTLQYDGEVAGKVSQVNVKINPHALKVIVP